MNNYKKLLFTSLTGLAALGFYACGAGESGPQGEKGEAGQPGASCTLTANEDGSATISCPDGNSFTVKNGENGLPGDAGSDGKNGTDCTASKNDDGNFDLVCGGQKVGTITNGTSCTLNDNGDGSVTVTCGEGDNETITILYKAVCGTVAYDPAKSFCSEGGLYSCDDKPYDPAKSFCSEGTLYSCGDKPYDPAKSFCSEGEAYDLCDGKTYDPKTQYCLKVTRGGTDIYSVEALLTDARDAQNIQVYKTVKICNDDKTSCQTWMAENLNYSVNPGTQSWCGGGEAGTKNEGDCSVYGRLYTWAAAVGKSEAECGYGHECDLSDAKNEKGEVRGVCPDGWRLPSDDDWGKLIETVGGEVVAGQKLKANSDLWTHKDGTSNDDSFGFAVLPAGCRDGYGSFSNEGDDAYFWSSTENSGCFAYSWDFGYNYDRVDDDYYHKYYGFSVRCLRD